MHPVENHWKVPSALFSCLCDSPGSYFNWNDSRDRRRKKPFFFPALSLCRISLYTLWKKDDSTGQEYFWPQRKKKCKSASHSRCIKRFLPDQNESWKSEKYRVADSKIIVLQFDFGNWIESILVLLFVNIVM